MFLCSVFCIMSPFNAATTTTPATVGLFRASPITMTVTMALTFVDLATSSQHDMGLPSQLIPRDIMGVSWSCFCATADTLIPDAFSGIYQLCHGSSSELSLPLIHHVACWCLLWYLLSDFRFPCGCHAHQWGLNNWGLKCFSPMEFILGRHMSLLVMIHGPY